MSLALVIKQRGKAYAAAQKTYKESVVFVNAKMINVQTSNLPALVVTPPDWSAYTTALVAAKGDALTWTNTVLARLQNVPANVQGYSDIIPPLLGDAITQATTLASDPTNVAARIALKGDLNMLVQQLGVVTTFISGAVTNIQTFKNNLPDLAKQLQSIADLATKDAGADQAQINTLKTNVANWQAQVNNLIGAIIGLGIADIAAAALATLATIVAWPEGAVVWLFAGVVIGIATYYIVMDGIEIAKLQQEIGNATAQMDNLTSSVAALHLLAQSFTAMANDTVAVGTNVQAVLTTWQALETDINTAVQDIQAAIANEGSSNFGAIKTELAAALAEWNAVYLEAGNLAINLTVKQGVQLTVGMTPAQVKAASDAAPSINIIDYYNQLAA